MERFILKRGLETGWIEGGTGHASGGSGRRQRKKADDLAFAGKECKAKETSKQRGGSGSDTNIVGLFQRKRSSKEGGGENYEKPRRRTRRAEKNRASR